MRALLAAVLLFCSPAFADSISSYPAVPNAATSQSSVAAPTAPNSTASFTMQGLAGSITPQKCGVVLIDIDGTIQDASNLVANVGITYQISHSTGGAPTSNAALTGTQDGQIQTYTAPIAPTAAADVNTPMHISARVIGLTPGTAYWIDLAAKAITTASQYKFITVNIIASEIC